MEMRDLGSILVKILESQAQSSLRLHQNLLDNIRVTSVAVAATGTTWDTWLSDAKLRILQTFTARDNSLFFVPSKLHLEVNWERGTTDTFS